MTTITVQPESAANRWEPTSMGAAAVTTLGRRSDLIEQLLIGILAACVWSACMVTLIWGSLVLRP